MGMVVFLTIGELLGLAGCWMLCQHLKLRGRKESFTAHIH